MWLDNLKELKKQSGLSTRQIVERTNLPERTVTRIFSGDTPNPLASTLHSIVTAIGGSLDDILADSKLVVGNKDLVALQEKVDSLNAENESLQTKIAELEKMSIWEFVAVWSYTRLQNVEQDLMCVAN